VYYVCVYFLTFQLLTDYSLFTLVYLELCDWLAALNNMASPWKSDEISDPRVANKRHRSAMSRGDDKVVEIDTLRAFTIPKMKKAKHGALHCFSGKLRLLKTPVVFVGCVELRIPGLIRKMLRSVKIHGTQSTVYATHRENLHATQPKVQH